MFALILLAVLFDHGCNSGDGDCGRDGIVRGRIDVVVFDGRVRDNAAGRRESRRDRRHSRGRVLVVFGRVCG